jgi:hypothetical protein
MSLTQVQDAIIARSQADGYHTPSGNDVRLATAAAVLLMRFGNSELLADGCPTLGIPPRRGSR